MCLINLSARQIIRPSDHSHLKSKPGSCRRFSLNDFERQDANFLCCSPAPVHPAEASQECVLFLFFSFFYPQCLKHGGLLMTSLLMVHSQIRTSFLQPLLFLSPENSGVAPEVMRSQWFAHDRVAKLRGMDSKSEQYTAAEMTLSAYRQVQNQHSVCEKRRLPCSLSLIVCVCVCV